MITNQQQLKAELAHFTGTTQWYKHLTGLLYTDGVQYVAEKCKAFWLIDYIFSHQLTLKIKKERFQVWKLKAIDNVGYMTVEDESNNVVVELTIEYTDFPLDEFELWFVDNVLLLPSEY